MNNSSLIADKFDVNITNPLLHLIRIIKSPRCILNYLNGYRIHNYLNIMNVFYFMRLIIHTHTHTHRDIAYI